ncbi:cysteine desulfurase family protein [Thermodesulfobacteriota bacterium]
MNKKFKDLIYMDHNATTPVEPEVVNKMMPFLQQEFGNPSSGYALGKRAKEGVERARMEVAALLGCEPLEVVFTSGGSESNNMVLKGVVDFAKPSKTHIITCSVEHPAVMNPVLYLMEIGVKVTIVPVDRFGRVDPSEIERAITPESSLISVMLANNETGTLQPIREIAKIASRKGVPVHTDAAQAVGKVKVNVNDLGVDYLSVAGHKLYAPKGIGALFVRKGRSLQPLVHGARQEKGLRAGTENVALSVGLGTSCRIAGSRLENDLEKIALMRSRLEEILFGNLDNLVLNGHPEYRLPNTINVSVPGIEGERILEKLPEIMASTGAACHDRTVKLSHVLAAMGVPRKVGMGALRFSLGRTNTDEQIDAAAEMIIKRVKEIRGEED